MNISYLSNRMKPLLPLLLIALFPGLCAAAKTAEPAMPERLEKREAATRITYQGGERKWLKKKYGNYEKLKQALVKEGGKYYDLVTIRTKKGKELVVYFDISGFFNREE